MFKIGRMESFLVLSLTIVFLLMSFSSSIVAQKDDTFSEIQEKLASISGEEKEVLQYLFAMTQEIEEMKKMEEVITQEIDMIKGEIMSLETTIAAEEIYYEKKRTALKQILKSYQRSGPGSYLETILNSDNLTMFLRRINTFRDLTHNMGELLQSLDGSRERLFVEKTSLAEKVLLMEEKKEQIRDSLSTKSLLIEAMEEFLESLQEERMHYQEYLNNIQQMLDQLKPLFSEITKEFSSIIEEGNLPQDAIRTTITYRGIKGSIDEKIFNDITKAHSNLHDMVFDFTPGKIEIGVPEKNLTLTGKFVILEGNILKFEVEAGSFYGMPLETGTIEELFKEGYIALNLKPVIGDSVLRSIEIQEGKLELIIIPKLF